MLSAHSLELSKVPDGKRSTTSERITTSPATGIGILTSIKRTSKAATPPFVRCAIDCACREQPSTPRFHDTVERLISSGDVGGTPIGCGGLGVRTVGCGPAGPGSIPGHGPSRVI